MPEHIPVLVNEVINSFAKKDLKTFFDGTLGLGGHAKAILECHPEIECYIGCDQDKKAIRLAEKKLEKWKDKILFMHRNFSEITEVLQEYQMKGVDGFLCDLGVSSMQLDVAERGFSFAKKGPLDMRMNQSSSLTAEEVINNYSEKQLGKIIKDYGEETRWRKIASLIVKEREKEPFVTTKQLGDCIAKHIGKAKKHLHPATLTFQALRIYVNQELQELESFLLQGIKQLNPLGIGAIISFHSLEDRVVKQTLKSSVDIDLITGKRKNRIQILTKKPIEASKEEIHKNPRARSAKLRVFQKIEQRKTC